ASAITVLALLLCLYATSLWMLGTGVFIIGATSSVFMLARQTFLTEAVPAHMRARAMSTLGGIRRVGLFIGPFVGAAAMHFMDMDGAYWVAVLGMLGAGLLSFAIPELEH